MRPREGVWWLCLCTRHVGDSTKLSEPEQAALRAAVRWVLQPDADHQQTARSAGQQAGLRSPAGCAAQAAHLHGHAAGPDQPLQPVNATAAARLVAAGTLLAVARTPPQSRMLGYRQIIALGLDADSGVNTWR
jgi:hypothetical protein